MRWHAAILTVIATTLSAQAGDIENWQYRIHRQCPSHHVEWISDGETDDLLAGFIATLPSRTQRMVDVIADEQHWCAKETMGFYCEMGRSEIAFDRLGLLSGFAAFECRHYICSEPSLCRRH